MLLSELNHTDYKLIVNKLVSFIVLEGKSFVSEEEKIEYVKSYLKLFVKIINQPLEDNKESEKSLLMENILKDLSNYL